ncbi:MAG TPA: PTS sugar transporter subunit IIA [Phycisphaerales bacterium]|nr:PTS sugar transporter subunit IIA [Phycisphaerales bacterium]
MRLSDIVCNAAVVPEMEASERDEVIVELVTALAKAGKIDQDKCRTIANAVIKREKDASTGIGKGVAVPHVKHKDVKEVVAAIGGKSDGIDFSSLDKQPVYSVILLISPAADPDKHLQAMENIFKNLQKEDFRSFLRQARTEQAVMEAVKFGEE